MPELPEVETIARSLEPHVVGRRIDCVTVACGRLRRPLPQDFAVRLAGRRICAIRRRAKYLIADLDRGPQWLMHMGMSGRLLWSAKDEGCRRPHDHVIVRLDDGSSLVFNDPRRFGLMLLVDSATCPELRGLGPEALDRQTFTADYLFERSRGRQKRIKDALLDQRLVAGIGNIYASEILFRARLRPSRRLRRLSRDDCRRIIEATRKVLGDAIRHRGTSVADFLDGIGRPGAYQWHRLVYARAGEPCKCCGTSIKSAVIGQRSSFYCPSCQR